MQGGHSPKKRRATLKFYLIVLCLLCGLAYFFQHYAGVFSGLAVKNAVETGNMTSQNGYDNIMPQNQDDYRLLKLERNNMCEGDLVLVNNNAAYNFSAVGEMVSIYDNKTFSYNVKDKEMLVEKRIVEQLNSMMDAFYSRTNKRTINIVAGYRNNETQQSLYDESMILKGRAHTEKFVAVPGKSEHHTGLALDFSIYYEKTGASEEYTGKGEYAWINENSHKYGFVQRYKNEKKNITMIDDEPWHFRYVGIPHASIMEENNFCLEEYVDFLKQYQYGKKHLVKLQDGKEYEIYFCEGQKVYVPKQKQYRISGNNIDGFIVTVIKGEK